MVCNARLGIHHYTITRRTIRTHVYTYHLTKCTHALVCATASMIVGRLAALDQLGSPQRLEHVMLDRVGDALLNRVSLLIQFV